MTSPWHDWWSAALIAGVSAVFAANAFRVGRDSYRLHLYLTLGNFGVSLAAYIGNTEVSWPSFAEFAYFLLVTIGAFFLTIGALTVFRTPKRVKCFRCEYVSWPFETDDPATAFDLAERDQFRQMHWAAEKTRRERKQAEG